MNGHGQMTKIKGRPEALITELGLDRSRRLSSILSFEQMFHVSHLLLRVLKGFGDF